MIGVPLVARLRLGFEGPQHGPATRCWVATLRKASSTGPRGLPISMFARKRNINAPRSFKKGT